MAHWKMFCAGGRANFDWLRKFLQAARWRSSWPMTSRETQHCILSVLSGHFCVQEHEVTVLQPSRRSMQHSAVPWVTVTASSIVHMWIYCERFVDSASFFLEKFSELRLVQSWFPFRLVTVGLSAGFLFGCHEHQSRLTKYNIIYRKSINKRTDYFTIFLL